MRLFDVEIDRYVVLLFVAPIVMLAMGIMYCSRVSKNDELNRVVEVLYRQCARWAVAAEQDNAEVIAVLHANYAAGYLWAIKDIVGTDRFENITGENFADFEKKIVGIQDKATHGLVTKCRASVPVADEDLLKAIYGKKPKPKAAQASTQKQE